MAEATQNRRGRQAQASPRQPHHQIVTTEMYIETEGPAPIRLFGGDNGRRVPSINLTPTSKINRPGNIFSPLMEAQSRRQQVQYSESPIRAFINRILS